MTSWLVRSSPGRAVLVRALAGDIVLCFWARITHFTLTVAARPLDRPDLGARGHPSAEAAALGHHRQRRRRGRPGDV